MHRPNVSWLGYGVLLAAMLALPAHALARAQGTQAGAALKVEAVAGNYQGTATNTPDGDVTLRASLKAEKGKLTGTIDTGHASVTVVDCTITGNDVTLLIDMGGTPGTITGTMKGDRIEGTWKVAEMSGAFTMTKAAAADPATPAADAAKPADKPSAATAAAAQPAAGAADPISGQWDGVTGNNEMSVPFTMNLKLEGEKVTGDISSDQGGAQFNPGVFKDGALTITFEFSGMGTVTMIGSMKEGKLVGSMDFNGQMQMSWAAVKKGAF